MQESFARSVLLLNEQFAARRVDHHFPVAGSESP
jgi:hypothetical protein